MNGRLLIYQVTELPDPFYSQYQMAAGGDVLTAACRDFEHLLRPVANLPSGSASVAIRFSFTPKPASGGMQSRLGIYVMARACDDSVAESLRLLFERGPLNRFYNLEGIEHFEAPWENLQATCEIVRREDAVGPLHSPEFNDRIPAYYYTICPFEHDDRNDYLDLDRVLGDIAEPVIIDICVQPADISAELSEHTRYLSGLQSINRVWDRDEDTEMELRDYLGKDHARLSSLRQGLRPLRYQDPLADDILRSQQRFHETLRQPHLLYHIKVLAQTPAVAQLLGSVVADSAFEGGSYRLLAYRKGERWFDEAIGSVQEIRVFILPTHESFFPEKDPTLYSGLSRLSHVATVDELLGIFRLPVASTTSPTCIRKNTDPPPENERNLIVLGFDQEASDLSRGYRRDRLTMHAFVSGTSGSGKTTSILNLILQLHQNDIPFLVLEPVKAEYRVLKTFRSHTDKNARRLAKTLEVYTPGNKDVSPFRFNPLVLQTGISVEEHIDNILSSFMAAMPVSGPLPALLGEALESVYEDHPDNDRPPIMSDLVAATERVLKEKGYSSETNSDIRAALEVRLGVLIRRSIGRVFQCRHSAPQIDHLMAVPAIIEFDRLHPEQACLLTLFLLTNIREYLKTVPKPGKDPRYIIIIEEAHNIVGRTGQALPSPDVADPKAFAAEYVCRMLAELRALGVGIIIVDQLPSAVAPEVIKNTSSKLAFRQVAKEDREELGAAMLFGQTEMEEIARLNTGDAFFFTEGYHRPRRIKTTNLHNQFDFHASTLNGEIVPYLRDDVWYKKIDLERTVNELTQLQEEMDRFDNGRLKIVRELADLLALHPRILDQTSSEEKARRLTSLRSKAYELKRHLSNLYQAFLEHSYQKYLGPETLLEVQDSLVLEVRGGLVNRFESIVKPDVEKSLDIIDTFISRCHEADT